MMKKIESHLKTCMIIVLVSGFFCFSASAESQDWPQFRGPSGQGIAENADPPLHWGPEKNIVWKQTIPDKGWSGPIVYKGSVYITTARTDEDHNPRSLRLIRLDADSGKILWDKEALTWSDSSVRHAKNSHASPTPIAENDRIYVYFGHMGSACLDEQGTVLWQQQELTYNSRHGNGGSQVLVDDKLIFICDGMEESFVAAIHKDTGKIVWKTDQTNANQVASFSTPCLVEDNGQTQLVCPGSGFVRAYNPDDGRQIWQLNYGKGYSVISRPVYGLGMVFVASGWSDQTLYAIRPNGTGDVTNTHVAWKTKENVPRTSSILLVDDMLFYVSDTGTATCVDAATGTVHWQEKIGGKYSASPVYAGGRIYCPAEDGKVIVLKAGTTFEKLAENDLDELTIASPAIVDKALFFRTESHLYRIEEK